MKNKSLLEIWIFFWLVRAKKVSIVRNCLIRIGANLFQEEINLIREEGNFILKKANFIRKKRI